MIVLLPLFGTLGILVWDRLPRALRDRLRPGMEVAADPAAAAARRLASRSRSGPGVESGVLRRATSGSGCTSTLGLVYDQRNCLVVGLAMGFAVIPIIFTIAEDALHERARST